MNKRRQLEKRGSSFLSKLRPLPIQRRSLPSNCNGVDPTKNDQDQKGVNNEHPTHSESPRENSHPSRSTLVRRESTRLQSFLKSFKLNPSEQKHPSGKEDPGRDLLSQKTSKKSRNPPQRSHSFNGPAGDFRGGDGGYNADIQLAPMPSDQKPRAPIHTIANNSSTYYHIELKKPTVRPGQDDNDDIGEEKIENGEERGGGRKEKDGAEVKASRAGIEFHPGKSVDGDFSISSPLLHESLNHSTVDYKSTKPSSSASASQTHSSSVSTTTLASGANKTFSPPPYSGPSGDDFAPDLNNPSNLERLKKRESFPTYLHSMNQSNSNLRVTGDKGYPQPMYNEGLFLNPNHPGPMSQSVANVPSLFHGNQDIHNVSFQGPIPPGNRRLTKTSSFCHGMNSNPGENGSFDHTPRYIRYQPLSKVDESSSSPTRRCPNVPMSGSRRPLVRRSASNVSDAYFSSPFQRGNELPITNGSNMHIYSQPNLNGPQESFSPQIKHEESHPSIYSPNQNTPAWNGPIMARSTQSPYAVSRTASLCHAESYHSLQTYQQSILRRQDFLQRQVHLRTYESVSQSPVGCYGTLPSRRSAFKPPPQRQRYNELEEYARQYEDLNSRRMWHTRSGPSQTYSEMKPQCIGYSEYQNVSEMQAQRALDAFPKSSMEPAPEFHRSSTLPRPPKVVEGTKRSSFESSRRFFNYMEAHKTQDTKVGYSTMSLPRKMPVKKLVSQFNTQIENQSPSTKPVCGTLTKRKQLPDLNVCDRRRSMQLPPTEQFNQGLERKLSMDEDIGRHSRQYHRHLPRNLEEERQSVEKILEGWRSQVKQRHGEPLYANLAEFDARSSFLGTAELIPEYCPNMDSGDLEEWRVQQQAERERLLSGQSNPTPPARPPKKPHLRGQPNPPVPPTRKPPAPDPVPSPPPPALPNRMTTSFPEDDSQSVSGSKTLWTGRGLVTPPPPTPPKSNRILQKAANLSTSTHEEVGLPIPSSMMSLSNQRTYHKDSYMAHRRGETLGQEGRYRRTTSSPPTAAKNGFYPSPPSIQEIHQNLLFNNNNNHPQHYQPHSPQIGASELANHNLSSADLTDDHLHNHHHHHHHLQQHANLTIGNTGWDSCSRTPEFLSQSSSSSGASTVIFTSDTLKKHRRGERNPYQSSPKKPPEVAPKPKLSLSRLHQFSSSNLNDTNEGASHGMIPLQSAKSTPSLHNILPMVGIHDLETDHCVNPNRWKNSLDSLDTVSTVSSSSPRHSEVPTTSAPTTQESKPPLSSSPQRVGPTRHHSASHQPQPPTSVHMHSHSDSGLSSLSGRTSTMSPVSTLSTVSSVSSGSSNAGSSRASLRSASIVSSTTNESTNSPPESLSTRHEDQESNDGSPPSTDSGTGTLRKGIRRKFQEEIDCEELSRELAEQLAMSSELQNLLIPSPNEKTLADYVEGILELDLEDGRGQPQRRVSRKNLSPSVLRKRIEALQETDDRSPKSLSTTNGNLILTSNTMKLPKNNFSHHHNNNNKNNNNNSSISIVNSNSPSHNQNHPHDHNVHNRINHQNGHSNGTKSPENNSFKQHGEDLQRKKEELLQRISQKLDVLRSEQLSLKEEMALNEELGLQVSHLVHQLAKPNECVKFNLHVEEIDKITSLLLGLSGRLARTENSLSTLTDDNPAERKCLEGKRKKLAEQLDEAKRLKENIDRRSATVSSFLHQYLNEEQYADYDHFVKMKAKLIMDSREISDKIKLGEEQIKALRDSLSFPSPSVTPTQGKTSLVHVSFSPPPSVVPPPHPE